MNSTLTLTQEWDKTFPQNTAVDHCKVTFHNRFGIELAADLYKPKNAAGKRAAVAVSGPFGAVKEQSSGLYAQELAARGFLTVAFDPSYTGESGGTPRYVASPDINTEDFSAAVDFLSVRDDVDPERIGILGICGWGGMALNAAAIDTRIKATVTSTMYDMTRVTANGYFDADDNPDARYALRQALNAQRAADYKAARISAQAAWSIRCQMTRRFSSRTTTTTTRPRAATTRARSTPPTAGTSRPRCRCSTRSCSPTPMRSAAPCSSSTATRRTRATSAVTPSPGSRAATRSCCSSPAPCTPISMTEWTSSRSTASKHFTVNI